MKKLALILLSILILTGCGRSEESQVVFDDSYYTIASPFKRAVGNFSLSSFDREEVSSMLMQLSMEHFRTNNSLYQEGQYLTTEELRDLLSTDKLNKVEDIEVDGIIISPKFITAIYEQNYLSLNGDLKGISLAIILNPRQSYRGGNNLLYKNISEEIVLQYGKDKVTELLEYMYSKEELEDIQIMVALFLENYRIKGSFKYSGITTNTDIEFENINYHYQFLDSRYVINNDFANYNNFKAIRDAATEFINLHMVGYGLYKDDELVRVKLIVTTPFLNKPELLYLSNIISSNLNFTANVMIRGYIRNNNRTNALIISEALTRDVKVYLLEE